MKKRKTLPAPLAGDHYVIGDLETLKVIADPTRLKILQLLETPDGPRTVKLIGAALKLPPTKLYYHINLLEERGLIRVASTRVVSGIIEKQYEAVATHFTVDQALLTPTMREAGESFDILLGAALDSVKIEIRAGIDGGLIVTDKEAGPAHHRLFVANQGLELTPARARAFRKRVEALLHEFEAPAAGESGEPVESFTILMAFYPVHQAAARRHPEGAHND